MFSLSASQPSWDAASHLFSAQVTLTNTSQSRSYHNINVALSSFNPGSVSVVNPDGYTSQQDAFITFGALVPGASVSKSWRFYSPDDQPFTFAVSLFETSGAFTLTSVSPDSFSSDQDTTVTISGQDIRAETAFFVQSTQLQVQSWSATQATVVVPAGLPPAAYGLMAVNPDGQKATLYPAFTVTQGSPPPPLDPKAHPRSFVEGYVVDYLTKEPIAGATVSLHGYDLSTTTGPTGYYLLRGVPEGRQAVKIEADGYEPVYRFAEVTGEQQTVTLKYAALEPKSTAVTMIGPAGGTHHANNGAFLVIPPGALDHTVPIQFTHTQAAATLPELPEDGYYLAFAKLEPTGLTFKKPATLYLPLQDGEVLPVGTPIHISYFDERQLKWVQDITSGVITQIDGRLYLEYEINHFTWIGGEWLPDPVTGCVQNAEGTPAVGVTTNWGVTDATGHFHGSTTKTYGSTTLTARVIGPLGDGATTVSTTYNGHQEVTFGQCVVLPPIPTPTPPIPDLTQGGTCTTSNVQAQSLHTNLQAPLKPQATDNATVLLVAGQVQALEDRIFNFSKLNADASSLRVKLGDADFTDQADIRYDPSQGDVLSVTLDLSHYQLPIGTGLGITVSLADKQGQSYSGTLNADVATGLKVPVVNIGLFPDNELSDDFVTPAVFETNFEKTIYLRERDVYNDYGTPHTTVTVPIRAVDQNGALMDITTDTTFGFPGLYGGSTMTDGVAEVPIDVWFYSGQVTTIDLNQVSVNQGQGTGGIGTESQNVLAPQAVAVPSCLDPELLNETQQPVLLAVGPYDPDLGFPETPEEFEAGWDFKAWTKFATNAGVTEADVAYYFRFDNDEFEQQAFDSFVPEKGRIP